MNRNKKLIWQIFPSFLVITLLSLLAVSWFASNSLHHFFIDQTAADLKTRALLVEKQIANYLIPPDFKSVDSFCKEIGKQSATRITVILPSGQVVGDSRETPHLMDNHAGRPEIALALNGKYGQSIRYSNTLRQQMMYVALPLKKDRADLGVIRTSIPITSIKQEVRSIQTRIAMGGLLIAVLAAWVSLLISRRISRPLEDMKKGTDHFAEGDLKHRLTIPASEELASLADALNQMAAQLDHRIKTIISQRNELETVLSSMLEGVIAVNNEERIINMNKASAGFFDCDPGRCQGRDLQEVIRNSTLQKFVRSALSSGEPTEDDIIVYQNGERTLNLKSSPLLGSGKESIGTLVVFNDVTQLRRLENMRRDFVANVSHEIKTPLTAIKGFVETLQLGNVDNPEKTERFLGIIQKHVDRLNSIVEDLLSLSRIEQEDERKALQLETTAVRDVLKSAIQTCHSKAEEKKIDVDIICEKLLTSNFDSSLLEQAVVNLLDNAIKYSTPNGTVHLKAILKDTQVEITVEDQGIGIAKKHQSRLFERFYRVDKARSRNLGGTGLGLAIVKHIAQAHGGHVSLKSSLGVGSAFTIHLPKN